jgi:nucleotide-binding universal stress UspA family protein
MFKTILVPVDLNHEDSWREALPVAVELARGWGAVLHVTAVVPDFGAAMVQGYFPPDFEKQTLERAEAALEKLVEEHVPEDVSHAVHLEHGSIRVHILDRAQRTGADLIVMAAHPPDQIREFLIGSHADWIVRHAPISVLVLRTEA